MRPSPARQPGPIDRLIDENFSLDDLERQYTLAVLDRCDWNKSEAARRLGIERTTLDRRLKKYGIPVEHGTYALPEADVTGVVRLRDA